MTGRHTAEGADALLTADENRRMFEAIVPRYDLLNRVLSLGMDRGWRRRAVRALGPVPGGRYLDVGCGTGVLCIEILRQAPACSVLGIDPAGAMLEFARKKVDSLDLAGEVRFEPGDVCALEHDENAFEGVISAFCIRNLTDRATAFREMRRVTKPGGTIVALELSRPRNPFLRLCHRAYNRTIVPLIGKLLSHGDGQTHANRRPGPG